MKELSIVIRGFALLGILTVFTIGFENCARPNQISGLDSANAAASLANGPTIGTVGASCSSEGTYAYDMSAYSPIFCAQSGTWSLIANTSVAGTWCGLSYVQSTPSATPVLTLDGTVVGSGISGSTSLCQGQAPSSGCPAGYTSLSFHMIAWNTGTNIAAQIVTCVKN